jgi:hypothetical protein
MPRMQRIDDQNSAADVSLDSLEVDLMRRVRLSVACVLAVFGFLLGDPAAASTVCQSSLPVNISGGMLQQQIIALLERSETFRQQCRRIAAAPYVRVWFELGLKVDGSGRAQTVINRYQQGAIVALVTVRFAQDYFELIPHELEHVIEQIDGVRLADERCADRAWTAPSGAYETRRAIAAGAKVRLEFGALAVEPVQGDGPKAPGPRDPFN